MIYRYKLDRSPRKFICPGCNKKRFVRYVDNETCQYLPSEFGRCDRESNCKYHLNPLKVGYKTSKALERQEYKQQPMSQPRPLYFIPESILNATQKQYDKNSFIQNLLKISSVGDVEKIISLYRLGTLAKGSRAGAVTFPFIDASGNIRAIQAKQFNNENHTISTDWVHSILFRHYTEIQKVIPDWLNEYIKNEIKVSCLFGSHLLNRYPLNPVGLVEAPKTAVIASLYYGLPSHPENLLWLAVYNKSSLTFEKVNALKGRKVFVFPDLGSFGEWSQKTDNLVKLMPQTQFFISDLLEKNASEKDKNDGLDLADYLCHFNSLEFKEKLKIK